MTLNFAAVKEHFVNWREWEPNPIVVKELRQAVRSWSVTGMLLLFLTVLFVTSLVFLVFHVFDSNEDLGLGGSMFSAFMFILAGACSFFIPLYIGIRVSMERQDGNPDLLYVSTLSPARIIRGKFLCAAYMALLFFSACMPFMAFTNLLRGIDLPTILFILFCLFLVVCAASMIAIFLACLPASRPFKALLAIYGIFQSFGLIMPLMGLTFEFMHSGVGEMLFGRSFWCTVFTFICIDLAIIGLFYVLSVALISPPSANRAWPVRIYLTAAWIIGGVIALGWVVRAGQDSRMLAWAWPTLMCMVVALLVTISNHDQLSLRVQRTIPRSVVARSLAFLFFNGAAGGLVWAAIILFGTWLAIIGVMAAFHGSSIAAGSQVHLFLALTAYTLDYSLLALWIHRRFLARRPPRLAGLLAIMLAAAWAITPSIVLFFVNKLTWKSLEGQQLGNPFNALAFHDPAKLVEHQYFALAWLVFMLLLNAGWFGRQVARFRPPPLEAPPVI